MNVMNADTCHMHNAHKKLHSRVEPRTIDATSKFPVPGPGLVDISRITMLSSSQEIPTLTFTSIPLFANMCPEQDMLEEGHTWYVNM